MREAAILPTVTFADDYDQDALRPENEKYKDVSVALAEGFIPDPSGHCVSAAHEGLPPEWVAMGIHYPRPDLLQIAQGGDGVDGGSTYTDFKAPAIFSYEPQADGKPELLGI